MSEDYVTGNAKYLISDHFWFCHITFSLEVPGNRYLKRKIIFYSKDDSVPDPKRLGQLFFTTYVPLSSKTLFGEIAQLLLMYAPVSQLELEYVISHNSWAWNHQPGTA